LATKDSSTKIGLPEAHGEETIGQEYPGFPQQCSETSPPATRRILEKAKLELVVERTIKI
jgi:hypothetical protein